MAKIPLRTYNREIEGMIDRGQAVQAVDHCLHILKFFPKHIDTYRLLGKAFLELQKYTEAADVLQRVLACVPDDFISQIGMAIIREEEGNLDAAICHMERAFEVQPSNIGVRDELRRLYGRRDGAAPEKIRLTRGALVRMYARGELYQQAIAEIRVALLEDPQRVDLETLLARMYFLSGQKVAATEVCSRLINKLPFCFEANRILAEVLAESARADDAKHYLSRVHAMDPYLAYLTPEILTSAEVPDSAVELERLEWLPEEASQPADWEQITGADWSMKSEEIPDWITGAAAEEEPASTAPSYDEVPEGRAAPIYFEEEKAVPPFSAEVPLGEEPAAEEPQPSESTDQIPEWMQQAGWQPASGEVTEEPGISMEEEEPPAAGETVEEIEQAEIPDWLAALAPTEEPETPEEPETTERLLSILPEAPEAGLTAPEHDEQAYPGVSEDESGIIGDLNMGGATAESPFTAGDSPEKSEHRPEIEETPERFGAQEEEPLESEFLTGITEEGAPEELPVEEVGPFIEEQTAASVSEESQPPDWLADLQAPVIEPAGEGETEIPSWLEELSLEIQEPHPELSEASTAEELTAGPFESAPEPEEEAAMENTELTPEGGAGMDLGDTQPVRLKRDEPTVPPGEPQPEPAPVSPVEEPEFDQTMSWLEKLTAEETEEEVGAELPAETGEPTPEWIQEITEEEGQLAGEGEETAEPAAEWSQELSGEGELLTGEPSETAPTTPDWMLEIAAFETEETGPELAETAAEAVPEEKIPKAFAPDEETLEVSESVGAFFEEEIRPPESITGEAEFEEEQPAMEGQAEESFVAPEESFPESAEMEIGTPDQFLEAFETLEPAGEISAELPEETPEAFETEAEIAEGVVSEAESAAEQPEVAMEEPKAELAEEELPDWLREMMSSEEEQEPEPAMTGEIPEAELSEEDAMSWLKELAIEEEPVEEPLSEPTAEEGETPSVPGVFIEEEASMEAEEAPEEGLPDWLRGVDEEKSAEEPIAEFSLGEITAEAESSEPTPEWSAEIEPAEVEAEAEPSLEDTSPFRVTAEAVESEPAALLKQAQAALEADNIDRALENYEQLIKSGQHLEDIIHDLRDALYRYPIDASMWQLLGDAYLKSNRLQDALDAYTKAEELLR